MTLKLSEITQSLLSNQEQDHMRWISQAIALGLSPWDPGKITAYYTDAYSSALEPILTFETELLPRLPFSTSVDLIGLDMHQALLKVADEAFLWFRYRHAVPIDNPCIILGED